MSGNDIHYFISGNKAVVGSLKEKNKNINCEKRLTKLPIPKILASNPYHLRSIHPILSNSSVSLPQREQVMIARLHISHTGLTYIFLLDNSDSPVCKDCKKYISFSLSPSI